MSLYQKLVRNAWKSGEYKAKEGAIGDGRGDAADLRSLLRSKMEWVVEREAYQFREAEIQPKGYEKSYEKSYEKGYEKSCEKGCEKERHRMKLAQYVKFREEKFGGVLFETRSEKVFTLSPTGSAIVKEIVAGGTGMEISSRLKAAYEDKNTAIEKEVADFISSLKEKGLVTE